LSKIGMEAGRKGGGGHRETSTEDKIGVTIFFH